MKEWTVISMHDGLFQGNNLSALAFCLGLRRALRRFHEAAAREYPSELKPLHMEYIDDLVVKFHLDRIRILLPLLEQALMNVNLRLNHQKCKVLIPSALEGISHDGIIATGLSQVYNSVELLGGALEGDFQAVIGTSPAFDAPKASKERLEKAQELARRICKMIHASLTRPSYRAAWTLIKKC